MVEYKFNEGTLIRELKEYIDGTYDGHYSKNKFQSTEFIIYCGHGMGFALGNVLKYAQRYGKKDGANRKDIMKILHYALIALHQHDEDMKENDFEKGQAECTFGVYNSPQMVYNTNYNMKINGDTK